MENNYNYFRPVRSTYDSVPYSERLAAVCFAHISELKQRCQPFAPSSDVISFDDLFHDTICIFVKSSRCPDTAPESVILDAFVKTFSSWCCSSVLQAKTRPEYRLIDGADRPSDYSGDI